MLHDLWFRIRTLFRGKSRETALDNELRFHYERQVEKYVQQGLSSEEAQRRTRLSFGDLEVVKDECRDASGVQLVDTLLQDIRFATRLLLNAPGFAAVAVLSIAIGIGANTAIFSVVSGVLLRPLPYRNPDRLTYVWQKDDRGNQDNVGYATYLDWRARSTSFENLAVYGSWGPILQTDEPEQLNGLRVTHTYFRTLGVHPELGRDFLPEEDNPASNRVVIISHSLWARKFKSDPSIVGKTINMNATSYVVAGVLPASYQSLMNQDPRAGTVEIWRVLGYDVSQPFACRTCHHLVAIGRLKDGVSLDQAQAEMNAISGALMAAYPKEYPAAGVLFTPVSEQLLGSARMPLYILLGAVSFVLLIACANLANLLLARATKREREVAVRAALGASRGRIVRQFLTENCLIAFLGAGIGLIPVFLTPQILLAIGAGDLPRLEQIRVDWRVLIYAISVAFLTGIIAGLPPALRLSRVGVYESLKEGSRGTLGSRNKTLAGLLIAAEVALSLTLTVGAGLLLRSLYRLVNVSPGFEPANVLTLRTSLVGKRYDKDPAVRQFFADSIGRLSRLPGVRSAAAASQIPLGGDVDRYGFHPEGKINPNPELDPSADRYCVTPAFLETMRIPLLRGRNLSDHDIEGTPPVILVNETTARSVWPGEDAIGKRVKIGGTEKAWRTIVGVVGDVHHLGLDSRPGLQVYIPHAQWSSADSDMTFVVRTSGNPTAITSAAVQAIHENDSTQPVTRVMPLEDYVGLSMRNRRFAFTFLAIFAAMAIVLYLAGVYAIASYSVATRTREIGIRMALGARRDAVLGLLLRQGLLPVILGIFAGLAASVALTRFLGAFLFGISATDPVTFGSVILSMIAVAAVATWVPSRRATRIDPVVALRIE